MAPAGSARRAEGPLGEGWPNEGLGRGGNRATRNQLPQACRRLRKARETGLARRREPAVIRITKRSGRAAGLPVVHAARPSLQRRRLGAGFRACPPGGKTVRRSARRCRPRPPRPVRAARGPERDLTLRQRMNQLRWARRWRRRASFSRSRQRLRMASGEAGWPGVPPGPGKSQSQRRATSSSLQPLTHSG